ncbi:MAG TPA: SBBP repeat-containing protein [Bryobacteraceae bacterium]|nr:SBBP repeat-containing protein [Bryobacteraceae bacterium]
MFRRLVLFAFAVSGGWCASGSLPIAFEVNRGQAPAEFGFVSRSEHYAVSLSAARVEWASGKSRVTAVLEGARPDASGAAESPLPGVVNYVRGGNPSKWLLDIPTYRQARYRGVYPGIDVLYYGKEGRMEYDFLVAAGANPNLIRMRYRGARRMRLSSAGDLLLETASGTIQQQKPVAYQERGGQRRPVAARYIVDGSTVRLAVAHYDRAQPLVIDPPLSWATYSSFHSSTTDVAAVATDPAGNVYISGYAISPLGDADCVVAQLNPTGTTVLYRTVLAGSGDDAGYAIAPDAFGNVYVTGQTDSSDFPNTNPGQSLGGMGIDAFAAKLDHTGKLVYSTYLGGSQTEVGYALAVDMSGNLYVAGGTQSSDFPRTGNAFQNTIAGGIDAFVSVFDPNGSLLYSTFFGGSADDIAYGIIVDPAYNVYLTGTTTSTNFPVTSAAFQPHSGGGIDGFVTKLAPFGGPLYSTYIGGSGDDSPAAIAVDGAGAAYVAGATSSSNFPTKSPFQGVFYGKKDIFAFKMNAAGSQLVYSTYVGGSGTDTAGGVALDANGNLYIAGHSDSEDFPTVNAFAPSRKGAVNGVVTALGPAGNTLNFSTYLGGSNQDSANGIALNCTTGLSIAGNTASLDFPVTAGVMQSTFGLNEQDGFVASIGLPPIAPAVATNGVQNGATFLASPVAPGSVVTIKGAALAGLTASALSFPLLNSMGGVTVNVNGAPAPLFYVSPTQINIQLPYEVTPGTAALSVNACGGTSAVANFTVAPAAPYILLGGNGQALIQNPDYSLNTTARPAHAGDIVVVYLIGIGAVDNSVPTGTPAGTAVLARAKAVSSATIAGQPAQIQFLGLTPNFVSLAQANVVVPNLASGQYDLTLTVGGVASNTVKLNVQ